ncbi:hypothetical protein C900_00968 [Fulvivirga imtechensis AK7]|uniref:Uncharacterized protein n=1 Tax=Fulvivirga imtechensis AK7 TaxID=1237149 RepID=L8JY65_9BACT|nr:hypothetical protein C900_00968 [Fulvivirga imtechensis AK7]
MLEKIGVVINLTLYFDLPRKQFVEILSGNIDEANNPATVFKR